MNWYTYSLYERDANGLDTYTLGTIQLHRSIDLEDAAIKIAMYNHSSIEDDWDEKRYGYWSECGDVFTEVPVLTLMTSHKGDIL